jgi:uncharacterized membrane protein
MNSKTIVAAITGLILMFFLGWLVWGILLVNFYQANTVEYPGLMKEMPDMIPLILGQLLMSFMLAFVFQRWAGIKTFMGGLLGGLILGGLISAAYDLYFLAGMNLYNVPVIIVDIIVNTAMLGLVGGVIGWILGYKKKE